MGGQATVRRAASQVLALLEEYQYRVAAFYDLFNTTELNTAIYPATCDTTRVSGEHGSKRKKKEEEGEKLGPHGKKEGSLFQQ